jgi:hypothetical protein
MAFALVVAWQDLRHVVSGPGVVLGPFPHLFLFVVRCRTLAASRATVDVLGLRVGRLCVRLQDGRLPELALH